jgi:hypothetical protein
MMAKQLDKGIADTWYPFALDGLNPGIAWKKPAYS